MAWLQELRLLNTEINEAIEARRVRDLEKTIVAEHTPVEGSRFCGCGWSLEACERLGDCWFRELQARVAS
jgi:hypothetical protein